MKVLTCILGVLLASTVVALLLFGGRISNSSIVSDENSVSVPQSDNSFSSPDAKIDSIIGMWKYTDITIDSSYSSEEDLSSIKENYGNLEAYYVFNDDHTATNTFSGYGDSGTHVGTWTQLTPTMYKFVYSYYSDVLKETLEIESEITLIDGMLYDNIDGMILVYEPVR